MKQPPLKKLKTSRSSRGFTTSTMARSLHISKTMYIYIEKGTRRLSYDLALEISEIFGMTPDELFWDDTCEFLKDSFI